MIGKIASVSVNVLDKSILATFKISNSDLDKVQSLSSDIDYDIEVKKHRERRSLDANSYFHVLVGKIADVIHVSKPRCKNMLISRYGQVEYIDNEIVVIKTNIAPESMLEQETLHTIPCGVDIQNGKEINYYRVYRGSHTYDTKEMSLLIDGTVEEAKALGIETITPKELERMKSMWGGK